MLAEAFAVAREIGDFLFAEQHGGSIGELCRSRAFVALAPYLPEALLGDALAAYIAIPKYFGLIGTKTWAAFVPRLSGPLLPVALAAVEAIREAYPRVMFLAILAPRLADNARHLAVRSALAATATIPATLRAHALAALAPYLSEADSATMLHAAFAETLAELCQSVPSAPPRNTYDGVARHQFAGVLIDTHGWVGRHNALSALAPHLPKGLLPAALTAARTINADYYRISTLIALLPFL